MTTPFTCDHSLNDIGPIYGTNILKRQATESQCRREQLKAWFPPTMATIPSFPPLSHAVNLKFSPGIFNETRIQHGISLKRPSIDRDCWRLRRSEQWDVRTCLIRSSIHTPATLNSFTWLIQYSFNQGNFLVLVPTDISLQIWQLADGGQNCFIVSTTAIQFQIRALSKNFVYLSFPPPSPPQSLNLSTEFGKGWRKMVAWSDQIKQMAPFSGFPTSCYGKLHKDFRLFRRPVFPLPLTTTVTFEMFVIFGFTTNTGLWKCVDWWSFDIDWQRFVNEGRATLFQTRLNLRRNWNLSGDWSAG